MRSITMATAPGTEADSKNTFEYSFETLVQAPLPTALASNHVATSGRMFISPEWEYQFCANDCALAYELFEPTSSVKIENLREIKMMEEWLRKAVCAISAPQVSWGEEKRPSLEMARRLDQLFNKHYKKLVEFNFACCANGGNYVSASNWW